jgi:hypothetical protein
MNKRNKVARVQRKMGGDMVAGLSKMNLTKGMSKSDLALFARLLKEDEVKRGSQKIYQ